MSRPIQAVDAEQHRTRVLLLLGAPSLAAFFASWLPMFTAVAPDGSTEEDLVVEHRTWTLLGVGLDPGDGGLQTTIRVLALLTLVLLAGCVYAALAPASGATERPAGYLGYLAPAALAAGLLLLLVTVQDDGSGRFGTDTVQPVGASWLLLILPLWFLSARASLPRR
ncbi:hypothetical protein BH11ACT8_BH11ACT8_22080 [soil metagenome]